MLSIKPFSEFVFRSEERGSEDGQQVRAATAAAGFGEAAREGGGGVQEAVRIYNSRVGQVGT